MQGEGLLGLGFVLERRAAAPHQRGPEDQTDEPRREATHALHESHGGR